MALRVVPRVKAHERPKNHRKRGGRKLIISHGCKATSEDARETADSTSTNPWHKACALGVTSAGALTAFAEPAHAFTEGAFSISTVGSKLQQLVGQALSFNISLPAALIAITALGQFIVPTTARVVYGLKGTFDKGQEPWESSEVKRLLDESTPAVFTLLLVSVLTLGAEALVPQGGAMSLEGVRRFTRPLLFLSGVVVTTRLLVVIEGKLLANAFGKDGPIGRRPEILLRVDGIKKLTSSLTVAVAIGISLRGIGVDVASLLTVGGISGLAIGLAGRQVLENVFAAFAIYLTAPFSPGEDIVFSSGSLAGVEGTVVDIGIFRTALRNYDRDLWTVPNSAFTSATVLNITRRPNEYQIYESVPLRPTDIASLEQAIFTFRKELKSDERVVPYLIQRVYLNKVASDGLHVVLRMYVFAANRTQFYNIRQDILFSFIRTCESHGVKLAMLSLAFFTPGV